jgi:hypothetical protein
MCPIVVSRSCLDTTESASISYSRVEEHIPVALEEHLELVAWQPLLGWLEWPAQLCRSL